jgi:sodium/bile acid cotransporter 7
MWAKIKFHFSKIISIALLILVWTVLCDLFQSNLLQTLNRIDLLIIVILNAAFFLVFTLLALLIARLPNICICRKQEINHDHQPLLQEHQSKSPSLIESWRFSRENTITFMFCGVTKASALGLSLIAALYINQDHGHVGLLSLPLLVYHVEQLILCSIEVILLRYWHPPRNEINI